MTDQKLGKILNLNPLAWTKTVSGSTFGYVITWFMEWLWSSLQAGSQEHKRVWHSHEHKINQQSPLPKGLLCSPLNHVCDSKVSLLTGLL